MNELIAITNIFVGVGLLAMAYLRWKKSRSELHHPLIIFVPVFGLVYFLLPGVLQLVGTSNYSFGYSPQAYLSALCFNSVYFLLALIGYKITVRRENHTAVEPKPAPRSVFFGFLIVLAAPFIIALVALFQIHAGMDFASFQANRIYLLRGKGYIFLGVFISVLILPLIVVNERLRHDSARVRRRLWAASFVTLCVLFYAYVSIGSRQMILMLLILLTMALSAAGLLQRRAVKKVAVGGSVLVVILLMAGFYRVRLHDVDSFALADIDKGKVLTQQVSNALGNNENLVWLADNEERWSLLGGRTFVAGLVNFVPRRWWPDKPFGGGPALRNSIRPGSYNAYEDNLTSFTTGLPAESVMNFGWFGGALVGMVHGILMGWVAKRRARWSQGAVPLVLYVFLSFNLGFVFLTNEFLGAFTRLVVAVGLLVFGMVLLRTRLQPRRF